MKYYYLFLGEWDLNYFVKFQWNELQKMDIENARTTFHEEMIKIFSVFDIDNKIKDFKWSDISIDEIQLSDIQGFKLKSDGTHLVVSRNYRKMEKYRWPMYGTKKIRIIHDCRNNVRHG